MGATDEPLKDKYNILFMVYMLYGFAALSVFNSVLSTLDYFIRVMPGYRPDFVCTFGLSVLAIFSILAVILYAHKIKFPLKNNLVTLI